MIGFYSVLVIVNLFLIIIVKNKPKIKFIYYFIGLMRNCIINNGKSIRR